MILTIHAPRSAAAGYSKEGIEENNIAGKVNFYTENMEPKSTTERVEQKLQHARKQAEKLVSKAWEDDKKTEMELDQTEQRDLKLLKKYQHFVNGSRAEQFSREDKHRLKGLENKPWSEFQSKVLQMNAETGELQKLQDEQREAARAVKAAVTDAMIGHINPNNEEKGQTQTVLKGAAQMGYLAANTALVQANADNVEAAQQHIKKILDQNNLVEEDIKGIKVDFNF